jgi:hypothetical protein
MSFAQLQELRGVELVAIKFSSEKGKPKFDVQHQSAPFVLPEIKDDFNDWGEERYVRCLYHNKKCEAARRGDGSMISRICDVSPNPPPAPPAGPASCSAAEHMGLHFDLRTFFDSHLSDDTAAAIKGSSGPHCKDISSKAFKSYILEGHFNRLDLWPGGPQDGTGKVEDSDFAKGEVKNSELGPCAQWAGLCHESNLNADGSYKDNTGYYTPAEMMAVRAHCPVTCSTLSWKDICNAAYMTDGYYFGGCKVNEHKQTCVSTYDIEEQCFFVMSADMTAPLYDDATQEGLEALFGGCTDSCTATTVDGNTGDVISYLKDGECDDGGPDSVYADCPRGTDCTDCGTRGTQSWPDWADTLTAADVTRVWSKLDLELEGHDSHHLCKHPAVAPHFGKPDPSSYLMERVTPTGIYGNDVGQYCDRTTDCPAGGFCNFDKAEKGTIQEADDDDDDKIFVKEEGTCESCVDYATKEACDDPDNNFDNDDPAQADCKDKCFRPVATSEDLVLGTTIKFDVKHLSSSKIRNGDTNYVVPNPPGVGPGGFLGEKFCLKPGHYTLKITDKDPTDPPDIEAAARAKVMPAAAVKQVFNDPEPLSLAQPDVHPLKPYYWVFPEASRTAVVEMLKADKLVTFANMAAANPDHIDVDNSP